MMKLFNDLLPETIFTALKNQGFKADGVLYPLNSYENRVYEIGVEDEEPLIGKFYRPGRWTAEQIAEEHEFSSILLEEDIAVCAPYVLENPVGSIETLGEIDGIYYAFFPKIRGREHADLTNEDRRFLGRTLARMHNCGVHFKSQHRLVLNVENYGYRDLEILLESKHVPADKKKNIEALIVQVLQKIEPYFKKDWEFMPLHGDCHLGNILWNQNGPIFLDFDDMIIAPAVQDIWMLFHGSPEEQKIQKQEFFSGYELFRNFDKDSLQLIEPLRSMRLIHHTAWIALRYEEVAFKRAFPYYQEFRFWDEFSQNLKEQIAIL